MAFVEIRELSKSYWLHGKRIDVLRSLSLSIERGELVSLVGASGSGKSTFLHVLGTLDAPVARALDFSRRNEDKAARYAMDAVEDRFDEIDRDFDELIAINNRGAYASLARYGEIQRQLILTLIVVGLGSLALTVIVGVWAWRQVARREGVAREHA